MDIVGVDVGTLTKDGKVATICVEGVTATEVVVWDENLEGELEYT